VAWQWLFFLGVKGSSTNMGRNNTIGGADHRGNEGQAHQLSPHRSFLGQNIYRESWRAKASLLLPGNLLPHRSRPGCSRVSIWRLDATELSPFAPPQRRRGWCKLPSSQGSSSSWMLEEAP
jgi:hypothetical protein